jgi:Flp pilus assembly protein TadG
MRAVRPPRNRERGAIAVLLSLLMTVLMGFAALGFDLAYVRLAREEMMNATDAAAHAAGITLSITNDSSQAQAMAISVASKNTVLGSPVSISGSDITFGTYNFGTKSFVAGGSPPTAVQVNGAKTSNGLVQLTFGRTLGLSTANTSQTATAAYINRYFQLELQISDDWICDIDNAADAAVSFLQFLNGPSGSQGDWIGLDVFTGNTKTMTNQMNVRTHYALDILPVWQRDATTMGIVQGSWPGTTPPAPPQTKGIAVCSKGNAPSYTFAGPPVLPANPGGYRQCPPVSKVGVLPTAQQYAFPNHTWVQYCSDGGPAGLYAGTDLGTAIHDGMAKIQAVAQTYEPKALVIITDGVPMACTGIGGGSLCGHTYGGDGVTPPSGKSSSDFWSPCCAAGLTCGSSYTVGGVSYGGGAWGDGYPGNSPNGDTACNAAHTLTQYAVSQADAAAAAGIDLFVIGFYNSATDTSAKFAASLVRNKGVAFITNDSTKLAGILQQIPSHLPVSIVR